MGSDRIAAVTMKRMLFRRRIRARDDGVLPLINIVFLLLVFFMVAGQLERTDPFEVSPPESEQESGRSTGLLIVTLAADGRLAIDGAPATRVEAITRARERLRAEPMQEVHLRVDAGVDTLEVLALADDLQRAGAGELYLMTLAAGR